MFKKEDDTGKKYFGNNGLIMNTLIYFITNSHLLGRTLI